MADSNAAGNGRRLMDWWVRGAGALRIRWGTPGDHSRCVKQLREHVRDPEALCAVLHHRATGMWPGDRRNQ